MGLRKSLLLIAAVILGAGLAAQAQAQSSPSAFTTGVRYDAMHRVVGAIEPDPDGAGPLLYAATRNTYDGAGRLIRVEKGELSAWQSEAVAPVNWTGFTIQQQVDTTYDALDRKTVESLSSAGVVQTVTQTSYDNLGRVDCVAVRMNPATWSSLPASACTLTTAGTNGPDRITHNVYDGAGQVLKIQKAYGTALQQDYATYTYSLTGKQASVTDADGNLATMGYDGLDRQATWVFPSPMTHGATNAADYEAYGYDPEGNRTSLKKRDNTTITYQYDALNRVTVKTVPTSATGAAGYTVGYTYDNRGLELSAIFTATGLGVTNAYDNAGRLASTVTNMDGTNRPLTSQYDADGNRISLIGPPGVGGVGYDYDGLDRMVDMRVGSPAVQIEAQLAYDQLGRRAFLAQGYPTLASSVSYAYDGASRLQSLTYDLAGTVNDQVLSFGYNSASQIVSRTRSNSGWEYTEQVLGSKSYVTNGLNQYLAAGSNSYGYDANGNLSSDGTNTYVYDAENRLVAVRDATGAVISTLAYDPMGRLSQFTGPQSGSLLFVYDGDQRVMEYSGATLQRFFAPGAAPDEPFLSYEIGVGYRHLYADHQGSIVALADDAGNMAAINKYDEWGVPAAANQGRFQYTGQVWLPDLGLYYYKARIYSSRLGRFLQTDPIGYQDQVNLYEYVGDDPLDGRDPTGNSWRDIGNLVLGTGELVVSGAGIVVGSAGVVASAGTEAGSLGLSTPVSVPAGLGSAALVAGSVAVGGYGAQRFANGLRGLLGGSVLHSSRGKNNLRPDPRATGPHSTAKRGPDGRVTNHAEYKPNPRNPSGHDEVKRVDVTGRPHTNPDGTTVPTPHVSEAGSRGVRPARPDELPR